MEQIYSPKPAALRQRAVVVDIPDRRAAQMNNGGPVVRTRPAARPSQLVTPERAEGLMIPREAPHSVN